MSLTRKQFDVLYALHRKIGVTKQELSTASGLSLRTVDSILQYLCESGFVEGGELTAKGEAALEPYRVKNAVIMAAGFASRFVPLSYEKPKGLLTVKGEVLIERQIRQLQASGISDITVVVGYMKEAFFYLEDLLGVRIVVNEEYSKRNNNSTLMRVRDRLSETYICSSDNYFAENVFDSHVYEAFYATMWVNGETDEYCAKTDSSGVINEISIGGSDTLIMFGHAYFDATFSQAFSRILEEEYDQPDTAAKLWDDMYMDHVADLTMHARVYPEGVLYEFDSMSDLLEFDHDFANNVDSSILDNICNTLECSRDQISDIEPIKDGLTNLSFKFLVAKGASKETFVYRHPGAGTDKIINRASEACSQAIAKDFKFDETYVFQDPEQGWKISRFIDVTEEFDYHNPEHVDRALNMIKKLHKLKFKSEWSYDLYERAERIRAMLGEDAYPGFFDLEALVENASVLHSLVEEDSGEPVLCHNDFYGPNILIENENTYLIDWEYSAMADYAADLGVFLCHSDYTLDEAKEVINLYFDGQASPEEIRHCFAYAALASYHWLIWALYKDFNGNPVGEWLYRWYKHTKLYGKAAFELYGVNRKATVSV